MPPKLSSPQPPLALRARISTSNPGTTRVRTAGGDRAMGREPAARERSTAVGICVTVPACHSRTHGGKPVYAFPETETSAPTACNPLRRHLPGQHLAPTCDEHTPLSQATRRDTEADVHRPGPIGFARLGAVTALQAATCRRRVIFAVMV
ncbi:uncharacterized protein CC84DRAFT_750828 [Paraphaeosphaeria sporulosa]|uniref:Uncharacterized protein n=1 Tax=Paraphaeosphaeria sporulosa TaxID=1460663 RepID=A0A177CES7_9PLEO|nr:uncharacterized protein CC84DRAFT_750828 [Paraphaeosphaeria sporulosa]OAG06134.1 hypothetical protein CC84DRAFT_750828 [Paraphaeosphaeria sporulosa]